MNIVEKAKRIVSEHRNELRLRAKTLLRQWHGRPEPSGSVLYQLCDQEHFDSLFTGFLTEAEMADLAGCDVNAPGDVDVWIEAAQECGFADYVRDLEQARDHGI